LAIITFILKKSSVAFPQTADVVGIGHRLSSFHSLKWHVTQTFSLWNKWHNL